MSVCLPSALNDSSRDWQRIFSWYNTYICTYRVINIPLTKATIQIEREKGLPSERFTLTK